MNDVSDRQGTQNDRDANERDRTANSEDRRVNDKSNLEWQGARTILSGLILTGIIAILAAQLGNHDDIAKSNQNTSVQFATIMAQVAQIQLNMADVPTMRDRQVKFETKQEDLIRRQDADDALHARLGIGTPGQAR